MNALMDTPPPNEEPNDRRIYGVSVAQVIANCDPNSTGMIQVRIPWLPGYEPWVRVAVPMAGSSGGTYFMPQVDEEVLLAFNHGDVREPYIVGSLWNGKDRPPHTDAVNKRVIRTPKKHEIQFDDETATIWIKTANGQHVTLTRDKVEISVAEEPDKASIILSKDGKITIRAESNLDIKAPNIRISGDFISIEGQEVTTIYGGNRCDINAARVGINDPTPPQQEVDQWR